MRLVVGLALLALTAGCSSSTSASDRPSAGNSGIVPPSMTAGLGTDQQVGFGQAAKVAFRPNQKRATVLELSVTGVRQGRTRDLAAYALDPGARAARPYYVRVTVTNLGPDDVGGALLPLSATTSAGAVVGASSFTQPFAKCRSTALPQPFPKGATVHTCLVFLVPRSATLEAMTDRTASGAVAVTWTGAVKPPRTK